MRNFLASKVSVSYLGESALIHVLLSFVHPVFAYCRMQNEGDLGHDHHSQAYYWSKFPE